MRTRLALVLVLVACLMSSAVLPTKAGATSEVKQAPARGCGGEWHIVPSPSPGTADVLYGIDGVASDDVWAVGTSAGQRTLIEHWDGTSWEIVPSPNPGTEQNVLYGVSAVSTMDAWAVGFFADAGHTLRNLILHWDGVAWSVVSSPDVGRNDNRLLAVSATSTVAWAVGSFVGRQGRPQALVQQWDGQGWTVVPSGGPGALYGVSADLPTDAWAVGVVSSSEVFHWNGTDWTKVQLPPPYSPGLTAVWAASPSDVWAAGSSTTKRFRGLAFHWDGASWQRYIFGMPHKNSPFTAVSGSSSSDVWFVGYKIKPVIGANSLAFHWNGLTFTHVDPPTPGRNALHGVVALDPDDVWAVGWIRMQPKTAIQRTFIVHFC